MKKCILILVASVWFVFPSIAQDDTTIVELGEVVVEENRFQIPFSETSRNITLITQERLQQSPVLSLTEMLNYVGGVDVRNNGAAGTSADISIRGGTFEQTLVLLNGVKMNDPQSGHHAFAIPIDFMNISQIEVLKGAAARTYGQNALAGVVNIRTEIADSRKVYLRAYGGDFGTYGIGAGVSLPSDKYAQQVYFARDASDGAVSNTDYTTYNLFYQSALKTRHGDLELIATHSQRHFGANGFYTPRGQNQYEEVQTSLISLDYNLELGDWNVTPRLYWRRNEDMYVFLREKPSVFRNLHTTQVAGAELHASVKTKLGTTGLGIENRNEYLEGNRLGTANRSNFGLFAEQFTSLTDKLDLTLGIYANYFSDYGWQAFPGADIGYQVSDKWRLYASVGRAFRIPTYTDLRYSSPDTFGNEDLKPEESWSYEGGLKFLENGVSVNINYYLREDKNVIDYLFYPTTEFWIAENIHRITTQGIEVNTGLDFQKLINPRFFLNQFEISYNYMDADVAELAEATQTRYTLNNFQHQLILGLNHKIVGKLTHQIQVRYLDRVTMTDYWILDSRLAWQKDNKSIFVEASNITNTEYQTLFAPMPKRWFRAGVNWNFGF